MAALTGDGDLWSIILAGGNGERLRSSVQRWFGQDKPKQYCAFIGTRSMFQHTLDRADLISPPERRVTVISRAHYQEAWSQLAGRNKGKIIVQPANRDTLAGIFLPLTYIRSRQPDATVAIFPSDHFVYPECRFVEAVQGAARFAKAPKRGLVLMAVHPQGFDRDYGWIQPGVCLGRLGDHRLREVRSFWEKPSAEECGRAMAAGALWNTLVLVAGAADLYDLGRFYFPEMMALFEKYREAVATPKEERTLEEIYGRMPACNFSSDLLERIPHRTMALEVSGILWSDWGRPERIRETLNRMGLPDSAFGLSCSLDHP